MLFDRNGNEVLHYSKVHTCDFDEGIYITELDLDLLRNYREHEIMGWKYRKPETYDILKNQ